MRSMKLRFFRAEHEARNHWRNRNLSSAVYMPTIAAQEKGSAPCSPQFPGMSGQPAVIAAVGVILAAVFDQSPLLAIILISLALCVYIAIRNRFDVEDEIGVRNFLDQREPEGTRDKGDSRLT